MKSIYILMMLMVLSALSLSQTYQKITIAPYSTSQVAEDPYNPNWDWEKGDIIQDGAPRYWIFLQNKPNYGGEYTIGTPWYEEGAWIGLTDRRRDDGWILLSRDFGTPTRRLADKENPFFVIYNVHRSILRVFIYLRNMSSIYSYSTMEMKQKENGSSSGVLAHLAPYSYAADKIKKSYTNSTSAVIPTLAAIERWIYADFPLSLDLNLSPIQETDTPPSLEFSIYGTDVYNIFLETKGFGGQGDKNFIKAFMEGNDFYSPSFTLNSLTMPGLNLDFPLDHNNLKLTVPDWNGMLKYFSNLAIDLSFPEVSSLNIFKSLFDGFQSDLDGLKYSLPIDISKIDFKGLFNFFVGGGMRNNNILKTAPTFISTHYTTTGTLTKKTLYAMLTIPVPNTRNNYHDPILGNEVGLVNNNPVGLITLKETPKLIGRVLYKRFNLGYGYYYDAPFYEYEIGDDLKYEINPTSNLELHSMEAYMFTEFAPTFDDRFNWISSMIGKTNQTYLIELESPVSETKININSMPVPVKYVKGRKLLVGRNKKEIYIRLKSVFKNKYDSNYQPVVHISTFAVDLPSEFINYDYGYYQQKPLPTIPPQRVTSSFNNEGGVTISWDKNREKNIKHYLIERSINASKFTQIGTTQNNDFIDNEIQKSVKVVSKFIKNVTVLYRVRALSEWKDELNVIQRQYSDYSDIVTAYGSYSISTLSKNGQMFTENNLILQNFPNPFNPSTTIYYVVKDPGHITIKIYNSLGQEIATLVDEKKDVGYHYAEWNATGFTSGIYFYRITNGNYSETKRMIFTK